MRSQGEAGLVPWRVASTSEIEALRDEPWHPAFQPIERIIPVVEEAVPVAEVGRNLQSPVLVAQEAVEGEQVIALLFAQPAE